MGFGLFVDKILIRVGFLLSRVWEGVLVGGVVSFRGGCW